MALKPETVELIRKVQAAILADPKLYSQDSWGMTTECGTACCVAGWVVRCSPMFKAFVGNGLNEFISDFTTTNGEEVTIWDGALALLELNYAESEAFFDGDPSDLRLSDTEEENDPVTNWPEPFASRWTSATTDYERAQIAVDRLEAYIAERESK